jgi:hypothetical protein
MQISQISTSAQEMRLSESIIIFTSFCLLVVSTLDQGMMGGLLKLCWLFSLAAITIFNLGAAVGLYIVSAAIFSVRHYPRWGSILERPDNFAMAIILIEYAFLYLRKDIFSRVGYLALAIGALLIYGLAQMAVLDLITRENFAWFMRMFGIPLIFYLMMAGASLSEKDADVFIKIMMALGLYMAIISIFERMGWYAIMIPPWIGDSTVNGIIGTGRSGGLLLQYEWNGLALGLIFCIILAYADKATNMLWIFLSEMIILLAIFFTYTRGAWLAVLFAILFMAFRSAPSLKSKLVRRFAIIIGILCFLVFMVLAVFPSKMALSRISDEASITYRFKLWTVGLRMVAQKPLLGHGFGQFREKFQTYYDYGGEVPPPDSTFIKPVAHNTLIEIVTELGIFGLMLYLSIFFMIYFKAKHSCSLIWGPGGTTWLTAFMIVYLINIQFIAAYEPTNNLIYYGMLGILAGLQNKSQAN